MRRLELSTTSAIALIAAAYGGVALASSAAVWMFSRTLEEMSRLGGGIGALSLGFFQASRIPLVAAWVALALTVIALIVLFARRRDAEPAQSSGWSWLAAVAVALGAGAVMLFRDAMAFVLDAALPGGPNLADAVPARLLFAGVGSAACFLVALVLAVAASRRTATFRVAVIVLVMSLGASAALIASLTEYSSHWRGVALEGQPIESRMSSSDARRQVYIGVSRTVNFDDSVSRNS